MNNLIPDTVFQAIVVGLLGGIWMMVVVLVWRRP
jgi:hypothetical protein